VVEALDVLSELGEDAAVLAGGMTLGPMLNLRMVRPRAVIDITRIAALGAIAAEPHKVATGAGVIQRRALDADAVRRDVPLLALALPFVGHVQTRNRGTLGGSVAHADPSAEIPLALVTSGGSVVLRSKRRERRVAAADFFLGALTTQRRPDEMIVALEWPRAPADAGHAFEEIAQRHGDFALAAAACRLRLDAAEQLLELSLGLGGVDSRPILIDTREFIGRPLREAAPAMAEHVTRSVAPMDHHAASAEFRLALAQTLAERVIERARADALARRERRQ
jgi:2-furoyl-CoA dehydrogenase FAD binding subunit